MSSPWKKESYKVIPCQINGGGFGQVYRAKETLTASEYAIKKIGVTSFRRKIVDTLKSNLEVDESSSNESNQEAYCLKNVLQVLLSEINNKSLDNTTFIVKCETCWFEGKHESIFNKLGEYGEAELPETTEKSLDKGGSSGAPIDEDFLFIPMEWCHSDLSKWIDEQTAGGQCDIQEMYGFWGNILQGLDELQRKQIIHRDIKPENILIKRNSESGRWIAKIGDFGLSTSLRGSKNIWQTVTVGTWKYMSPEMKGGRRDYDYKTDVFSAGLTFAECLIKFIRKMVGNNKINRLSKSIDTYLEEIRNGKEPDFLNGRNESELIVEMCQVDVRNRKYAIGCLELLGELLRGTMTRNYQNKSKERKAEDFLKPEEIEFLKQMQNGLFGDGKFEGIHVEDEEMANYLLENFNSSGNLLEAGRRGGGIIEIQELFDRVKLTLFFINEGSLWWNPNVISRLPGNYIERRIAVVEARDRKKSYGLSDVINSKSPFSWLVDSPGMGKSTVTTKLEEMWRRSIPSWRIVVRLNLNLVQETFEDEEGQEGKEDDSSNCIQRFLRRFAPFIPTDRLTARSDSDRSMLQESADLSLKVIILLDGLDEVGTQNEQKMLRILQKLLIVSPKESTDNKFLSLVLRQPNNFNSDIMSLRLHKVFLTTRPHLKYLVKSTFKVNTLTLLPFNSEQRLQFLSKEVSSSGLPFSEEQAKNAIMSLSPFVRQLMGNPLLLFLFAQVIKASDYDLTNNRTDETSSITFDLYDLYERFMKAKHWLYVVEKEVADPTQKTTATQVLNTLEASDPFYFSCALSQLKPTFQEVWPSPDPNQLPEGQKLNELLSIGLLIMNIYRRPEFVHKSFAEFFLVRLMISPSTPDQIRDSIFAEIHGTGSSSFDNVAEFLLCVIKNRQRFEDPQEKKRLLPITKGWLAGHRFRKEVIIRFLKGKLFPILGEEIFSNSIDYSDSEIIDALVSFHDDKIPWPRLINLKEPEWLRSCVFGLPQEQSENFDEASILWSTKSKAAFASAIFCFETWALERKGLLSEEEIASAFSLCGNIVGIVCNHSRNFQHVIKAVRRRLGRESLKEAMTTKDSLNSTLTIRKGAWWVAEVVRKDELRFVLTEQSTRVIDTVGEHPRIVDQVWGEEFLGDLFTCRFKFIDDKVGQYALLSSRDDEVEYMLDKVWGRLASASGETSMTLTNALREIFMVNPTSQFLRCLEEQMNKRRHDEQINPNIIEQIVLIEDETYLWDKLNETESSKFDFYFLPYIVRYGKLSHIKKIFSALPYPSELNSSNARFEYEEKISVALLLALLVDESNETFEYLRWMCENVETPERHSDPLLFLSFFEVELDDLRKQVGLCSFALLIQSDKQAEYVPLVCQVSWGEILLRLSPNYSFLLQELPYHVRDKALKKFFHWSKCGELSLVVDSIVVLEGNFPKLIEFLVKEASGAAMTGRLCRPYDFPSQRRLLSLLQFINQFDGIGLSWLPEIHQVQRLSEILVNFHLSWEVLLEDEREEVRDLVEAMRRKLKSLLEGKTNVEGLLSEISPFRSEREWSIVLKTLEVIPSGMLENEDISEISMMTYGDPVTPLLRVWARFFGEEVTLKAAEEEALPFYVKYSVLYGFNLPARLFIGGEALLLAVELGCHRLLEELMWPSHLGWKNPRDGKSLLEIARDKWGQGHQISTFLRRKSKLTFCCDN